MVALAFLSGRVEAAISVGPAPTGTGTQDFAATPAATEWSTLNVGGAPADFTTAAALDADVKANINAASVNAALGTTSTLSPSVSHNAIARHNTGAAGLWLQTVPNNATKYVVLMATLKNDSGKDVAGLEISYDLGLAMPAGATLVEEVRGHRVFYSQTGAPGSWTSIPALSTGTPGRLSATVDLGKWAQGALLYLLWVDDDGSANRDNNATPGDEEGGYTIDNWIAVPAVPKKILVFQQGLDGYTGTVDTELRGGRGDEEFGAATVLNPDGSDDGGEVHPLIRFENMFGNGPGQIPPGKLIQAVTLTINIVDAGNLVEIHRVNKAWAANTTWNQFDPVNMDGVLSGTVGARAADDTEAVFAAEATIPASTTGLLTLDLSAATVQAWADGAPNYGWAFIPTGTDGVDFSSSEGAAVDARPKLTVTWGEPGEPLILPIKHTPFGFEIQIEDGKGVGAKQVDQSTIKVKLDGAVVTTASTISKAGNVTTVSYRTTARFASVSQHVANVAFTDNNVPPRPQDQNLPFQVVSYAVLPPAVAVPEADIVKSKPGFMWSIHQNDEDGTTGPLRANSNVRALQQLNGLIIQTSSGQPYANTADPAFQGVALAPALAPYPPWGPISFEIPGVINLSQVAGDLNGNFTPDLAMPGISSDIEGIAAEIFTYLELPAGFITMGVNSDDGFITTAGNATTARDALQGIVVGEFDAGRGAADTIFYFVVEQPGYYAFRTIWEEGNGGANIEWFTVKPDGTKVLVNDTANGGVKAYRAATSAVNPYVVAALPSSVPRLVNQPSSSLSVVLADGNNAVDQNSVKLSLNGKAVTPTFTRRGKNWIAAYTPTDLQIPSVVNTGKVEFKDSTGAYSRSSEWSFRNLKNIVLPTAKILETFNSTSEGQVPTGWTRQNFTSDQTAGVDDSADLDNLNSDAFKDFLVLSRTRIETLKPGALNVAPDQVVNGKLLDNLIEGNFVYAESDVRGGDQVQFLTTSAFDLSGFVNDAVLSFHSIYEQNQDSIGAVEYSIDDGKTWQPVIYFLDGPDIKLNPDGSVNGVKTMTDANADTAAWTDPVTGLRKGDIYGAFLLAPITDALGAYIEPRVNDNDFEGKRVEVYYLPGAAKQSKVRLRFAQGGTGSWYFGIDDLGFYDVQVSKPQAAPPKFNSPALQAGNLVISWTGNGTLLQADTVTGPWTTAPSQNNPQNVSVASGNKFYRLKQ